MESLEGKTAEIKDISKYGIVLEVEDVELSIGSIIERSGCGCCGDVAFLDVVYNKRVDGDPLDLNSTNMED